MSISVSCTEHFWVELEVDVFLFVPPETLVVTQNRHHRLLKNVCTSFSWCQKRVFCNSVRGKVTVVANIKHTIGGVCFSPSGNNSCLPSEVDVLSGQANGQHIFFKEDWPCESQKCQIIPVTKIIHFKISFLACFGDDISNLLFLNFLVKYKQRVFAINEH